MTENRISDRWLAFAICFAFATAPGCLGPDGDPQIGSESHFVETGCNHAGWCGPLRDVPASNLEVGIPSDIAVLSPISVNDAPLDTGRVDADSPTRPTLFSPEGRCPTSIAAGRSADSDWSNPTCGPPWN